MVAGRLAGNALEAAGSADVAAGAAAAAFGSAVSGGLEPEAAAGIAAANAGQAASKLAKARNDVIRGKFQEVADAAAAAGREHGLSEDKAAASGAMAAGELAAEEA